MATDYKNPLAAAEAVQQLQRIPPHIKALVDKQAQLASPFARTNVVSTDILRIPKLPPFPQPRDHRLADALHERLVREIRDFENTLQPGEEVGALLASFGTELRIHVRFLGWRNPDLLIIMGEDSNGNRVKLMQHVSQTSLLLLAIKPLPGKQPAKVGFDLGQPASKQEEVASGEG